MDLLVANLLEAYRRDISELPWMSAETKASALEKLAAFTPKIGYPQTWRDYSALSVHASDLAGNARRAAAFELDRHKQISNLLNLPWPWCVTGYRHIASDQVSRENIRLIDCSPIIETK